MRQSPGSPALSELRRSVERAKGRLALAVVLTLVSAATGVVTPLLVGRLLTGLDGGSGVATTLSGLVAVVLVGAFAGGWSAYLLSTVGEQGVAAVRRSLLQHVVRLPVPTIRRVGTGELLTRLTGDAALLRTVTDTGVTALPISALLVAAYLTVMGVLDPLLLGVVLGTFALAALAMRTFLRRMRAGTVAQQAAIGGLAQSAQSVLDMVTTVKACTAEDRALVPVAAHVDDAAAAAVRTARSQAAISPLMGLAQQVAIVAVLSVGGAELASGRLTGPAFIAFLMYLFQLVNPLMTLAQGAGRLQTGTAAAARIDTILREPTEDPGDPLQPAPSSRTVGPTALRLTDVHLRIGSATVLSGVTLEVPRTGLVAVVGTSGAGKSTLFELAERFTAPDAGEVTLLGTDLRRWPLRAARQRIALVQQGEVPLRATVRTNLELGLPDERLGSVTDAELLSVLAEVGLEATVRALPQGLDTVLGESARLSGGEVQRLAIARALLSDADVLLLDEPTSALDGVNERRVVRLLTDLSRTRAVVVVAHRLSTVEDANPIVVLDAGRVVGVGDHASLLAASPQYGRLVRGRTGNPDDLPTHSLDNEPLLLPRQGT